MILESQGQHIALKKKVFTALVLAGNIMRKYIYLTKKAIMILINLGQGHTQLKCIQWVLKAKDMAYNLKLEMFKVKLIYQFSFIL